MNDVSECCQEDGYDFPISTRDRSTSLGEGFMHVGF